MTRLNQTQRRSHEERRAIAAGEREYCEICKSFLHKNDIEKHYGGRKHCHSELVHIFFNELEANEIGTNNLPF